MKKFALLAVAALMLSGCASTPEVEFTGSWVKSSDMSVVGGMTAVFGTITNNTNEDITLVGGTVAEANVVEIHEMAMSGGEMVMQKIEGGLVIPAGETAVLEPGGNHVMLMDLNTDIVAGDSISVTLDFDGAEDLTIDGIMAKPTEGGDEDYHSEDMDMDN
jgi:copper(I)-binding protein